MNEENRKSHFEKIYQQKLWGFHGNTLSGRGSSDTFTNNDAGFISEVIKEKGISSIVDVCGDFAWQHKFLSEYKGKYLGVDISEIALKKISKNTSKKNTEFRQLDICRDEIPPSDLFICRDVLFHLSHDDILLFLKNLKSSETKWLITTTFLHSEQAYKGEKANACQHNLTLEPYNLKLERHFVGNKNIPGYEKKALGIIKVIDIEV